MKKVDLRKRYESEIRSLFDWENLKGETSRNFDGDLEEHCFLGSCFYLMPSGKFYMPWTTNQTAFDVIKDSLYREVLEEVAEEFGWCITGGEGDPCDIFAVRSVEEEEEEV